MKLNRSNDKKQNSTKSSFLPRDAAEFLKKVSYCENNYLSYYRFGQYQTTVKRGKEEVVVEHFRYRRSCNNLSKSEILQSLRKRQELIVSQLPAYMKFHYKLNGRILLGIGGVTPYTTISAMTLHPVYGIPYIPGSSLKGVVRNYWLHEHLDGDLGLGENASRKVFFDKCFGTGADDEQLSSGKLIFLDAYPVETYQIVKDVQTPHYKTYYNQKGSSPPRDDDSPNIIPLMAIEDTIFDIYIGMNFKTDELDANLRNEISKTIISTLSEYGVGAKTAIGYGLGEVTMCDS
ncbi:CRISPR-associated RAMP Cmr6 family protein [Paenibacillus larvae subsp. larvae DSM 25430]|uniref:CRISPR-associated RAMP Cmr6 family protein n=1 Tax=Paenibacillus larvae subsp. larvae TaxID=147375 RepID=A0A6C0QLS2_9BACL|nr:CRISPR-associated RAMP Cmr6 family protein [Paenibacillus larvae subsp. larvae DSM 25430]QHZ49653.1 CRISPR-associated RAMP Cmr6 family protein [Paenibacillus larvae subsp. larvae]